MSLRDTQHGYSWLSIALHWIAAISVIGLFLLAELSEEFSSATEDTLMMLHVSLGMTLAAVLWLRIFWRMANKRPALAPRNPVVDQLAKWVPRLLLAGIAIMLVSGPLMIWSNGKEITLFNTISLPAIMDKNHGLHEWFEEIHEFGADLLLYGVVLHALGALKHLVVDRDGTFRKILVAGNK